MVAFPFLVLQIVSTIVAMVLAGIATYNVRRFLRLPSAAVPPDQAPRVSILVPARNEERGIEACVVSLCEQTWPNLEVVVLDDQSTDATAAILQRLAERYPGRLRLLQGTALPEGWVGKSWACHQLSAAATGAILLFTDADTEHHADTVACTHAMVERHRIDVLSLIPDERMGTWLEHVVIPMVHVLYVAYLPNDRILHDPRVSVSAANGQFMWFSREAYRRIDGHRSVAASMVEDVTLARIAKKAGLRLALVDGSRHVACRMYTNGRDVVAGFSKNMFPAMGYRLAIALPFVGHMFLQWVLPLPALLLGLCCPSLYGSEGAMYSLGLLPAIQLVLGIYVRGLVAGRFRMPWWHVALQPLSGAMTIVIALNSIRWAWTRRGATWKGRSYHRPEQHHARTPFNP